MDTSLELSGKVRLVTGSGGLPRIEVTTALAEAHIYLHGAHVTHFAPTGQSPVLFMSAQSAFLPGKPIRGGVPIIFPWFGPRQNDPASPAHGFARTQSWATESIAEHTDGSIVITLKLEPSETSRALWPAGGDWALRHRITVGRTLTMELELENRGGAPLYYEDALHTYFQISEIRNVEVRGLERAEYLDKADGMLRKRQNAEPIRFSGETVRIYVNTVAECVIADPGLNRRILIGKSGCNSTVVWNPWIAQSQAMADFGDEEWPAMVCVETGNIADNTLQVAPGDRHLSKTVISVEAF